MKKIIITIFTLFLISGLALAQDVKEDIDITLGSDEYERGGGFVVKNVNGDVTVTGYDGDEIQITGTKKLWKERGDISSEEAEKIQLATRLYEGKIYVYIDSPETHPEFFDGRLEYHWHNRDRWDDDDDRIRSYFDLEIKIPANLSVEASTVNGGEVNVSRMNNGVRANNVNGSVVLKDVAGETKVNTVNGSIEVWFSESPTTDSDFKTVNGTIEIYSPSDLDAVVTFESLHGDLYTDFEQITRLPNRLDKQQDGDGFRYKINKTAPIQIGDGGPEMSFKMVNGSAYIHQRKS